MPEEDRRNHDRPKRGLSLGCQRDQGELPGGHLPAFRVPSAGFEVEFGAPVTIETIELRVGEARTARTVPRLWCRGSNETERLHHEFRGTATSDRVLRTGRRRLCPASITSGSRPTRRPLRDMASDPGIRKGLGALRRTGGEGTPPHPQRPEPRHGKRPPQAEAERSLRPRREPWGLRSVRASHGGLA